MNQNIRKPLGFVFLIIGLLLVGYGTITRDDAIYVVCGNMNLNLIWGAVMAVFGASMLSRRASTRINR